MRDISLIRRAAPLALAIAVLLLPVTAMPAEGGRFGLVFVYGATCPFSRAMSPVVKAIARDQAMPVLAVTTDGYRLDAWPATRSASGQIERLGIARIPFLALYDWRHNRLDPLAAGAMPAPQLNAHVNRIIRQRLYP